MKVILFGATGMVGQGVLRECLLDSGVESILLIGRTPRENRHSKVRELVRPDLTSYAEVAGDLQGFDACFFCLGVSSSGMNEAEYEKITYGITLAAAELLARQNPQMTFVYVSGLGTDSSERGRIMWARVKGRTENAILRLPFAAAYAFRPGFIEPRHGEKSRTAAYRIFYRIARPLLPLLRLLFPNRVLTTEQIGRAMLKVARLHPPKRILESSDIRAIAREGT